MDTERIIRSSAIGGLGEGGEGGGGGGFDPAGVIGGTETHKRVECKGSNTRTPINKNSLEAFDCKTAVHGQLYWSEKHGVVVRARKSTRQWFLRRICQNCNGETISLKTAFCRSPYCDPSKSAKYTKYSSVANFDRIKERLAHTSWSIPDSFGLSDWLALEANYSSKLEIRCNECHIVANGSIHDLVCKGTVPRCMCTGLRWNTEYGYARAQRELNANNLQLDMTIDEWLHRNLKVHDKINVKCKECGLSSTAAIANLIHNECRLHCLCANKLEGQLFEILCSSFDNSCSVERQYRAPDAYLGTGNRCKFDIVVLCKSQPFLFVELDGPHHFGPCWYSTEEQSRSTRQRDLLKERYVFEKGASMIRIEATSFVRCRSWIESNISQLIDKVCSSKVSIAISCGSHYNDGVFMQERVGSNSLTYDLVNPMCSPVETARASPWQAPASER